MDAPVLPRGSDQRKRKARVMGFARWLQQKGHFKCLIEAMCRVMSPEVRKEHGLEKGVAVARQGGNCGSAAPWDGIRAGEQIEQSR